MKKLFTLLFTLLFFIGYSQINHLEIPKCKKYIDHHNSYELLYSKKYKISIWTAYELIPSDTIIIYKRKKEYYNDYLINNTANKNDYYKSGYDRGHLVPARDMRYNFKAINDVNCYSNISPQNPSFNRGIWKKLETKVSHLTRNYDHIYIVTGPILTDSLPTIGKDKVVVPNFYYKVIVTYRNGNYKGIGFIIPNKKSNYNLDKYCVPIDFVESITNLDFFYKLDDKIENVIEKNSEYKYIFK